jgi:hypothetical protein
MKYLMSFGLLLVFLTGFGLGHLATNIDKKRDLDSAYERGFQAAVDSMRTTLHPTMLYKAPSIWHGGDPPRTRMDTTDVGELVICVRRGDSLIELSFKDTLDTAGVER